MVSPLRVCVALSILVLGVTNAHAQFSNSHTEGAAQPIAPIQGLRWSAVASLSGSTDAETTTGVADLATVVAWTRSGLDRRDGFRGPRWTHRVGAALAARTSFASDLRVVELEQQSELALYAFSVGQTIRLQARPRLTERMWWNENQLATAFIDFPGFGKILAVDGRDASVEAFAVRFGVVRGIGGQAARGLELDFVAGRLVGEFGEMRLLSGHVRQRERALEIEENAIDIRVADIFPRFRPWRLTFVLGGSLIYPDGSASQPGLGTMMPNVRVGFVLPAAPSLRRVRSEIGRSLLDDGSLGFELATLHRLVENVGVDAGVQLVGWWQAQLDRELTLRGEAMFGVGARRLEYDPAQDGYRKSQGALLLTRGDLTLRWTPTPRHGFGIELHGWVEHSERGAADLTNERRWSYGLRAGLSWSRG